MDRIKQLPARLKNFFDGLTLSQRFMLAGLVILLGGMVGIGAWVEQQIVSGVIRRTGAVSALYVDSFLTPLLQELGMGEELSPQSSEALGKLLQDTPIGKQIVRLNIWSTRGKLLYSADPTAVVGKIYPMGEGLLRARLGKVVSEISELNAEENQELGLRYVHLLETYTPVWLSGTNRVIAVAEFYQDTTELDGEIAMLKQRSRLVVGPVILVMYLLLAIFVRRASNTITQQKTELANKVSQLTKLLVINKRLQERIRRASASVAALNESYLHRIGAELHDGPAQELGLAVLKLDALAGRLESKPDEAAQPATAAQLSTIGLGLQNALKEIRAIAAGVSLPQLASLSVTETVRRAIQAHERRSGTSVQENLAEIDLGAPLPIKITLYRLVQEGLNNAFRHAGGLGQSVKLGLNDNLLILEIADRGPGFDIDSAQSKDGRLGLNGMRERVESLGGQFRILSEIGEGTTILAELPVQVTEGEE
jgi:signal transduction histidine kinase